MGKDTISAREQHTSPDHLSHNAAHWPYIHWRAHSDDRSCKPNDEKKWKQQQQDERNGRDEEMESKQD